MKKIPVKRTMPGGRKISTGSAPKKAPSHDLSPTEKPEPFPSDLKAEAVTTKAEKSQGVTVEVPAKSKPVHQHTVRVDTPLKVTTMHTVRVETTHHMSKGAGRGRPGCNGVLPQKEKNVPEGSVSLEIQTSGNAGTVLPESGTAASAKNAVPDTTAVSDKGAPPDTVNKASSGDTISSRSVEEVSETAVSRSSTAPDTGIRDGHNGASPRLPELRVGDVCETGGGGLVLDLGTEVVGTDVRDLGAGVSGARVARDMGAGADRDMGAGADRDMGAGADRDVGGSGFDMGAVATRDSDAGAADRDADTEVIPAGIVGDLSLGLSDYGTSLYSTAPAAGMGKAVGDLGFMGSQPVGSSAMWTPLGWDALQGPWSAFVNPEQAGYVGFANLPNQVHRKSVKKGFEFTLMVVGESGLGKSTLVNSLFLTDLYPERHIPTGTEKIQQTVKIDASTVEIEERGVKLRLTVVDTPGFGDSLNSTDCFKPIIRYIDDQFERYLQDESGLNRRHIIDNRVHCCFYFINPSSHGLKPLDVAFMRTVHHKVNIVPVLAKADTLTKLEVTNLKRKILDQIEDYGIKIYPLPDCDSDEDEDYKEQCRQLKNAVPFAVVGANAIIEVKGRKVRGRMYPWGVVEVENPDHCDFIKLRTMLITHMQDLQEVTQEIHYENYRAEKLANGGQSPTKTSKSAPPAHHDRVMDRERELIQKEEELRRMHEKLARMQAEIDMKRPGQQANGNLKTHDL